MSERVVMASKFKAECLAMLDRLEIDHVPIVVTKRGRPVARVVAYDADEAGGETSGSVTLLSDRDEDYFSTGVEWEAGA